MQIANRKGRVNYEPNGWGEGPRAHPLEGYISYKQPVTGDKVRLRPESFADHYSQARQFYISQTESEQGHMLAALVFELSKCKESANRERMVAHLMHIDTDLAEGVAEKLGLTDMPEPPPAAQPTQMDLKPLRGLSIQSPPPDSFKGRILGVLISDGFDGGLLMALKSAVEDEGGVVRVIAPKIGGAMCRSDHLHPVTDQLGGAPSVLFDAVALIPGGQSLALSPAAIDFVKDAYTHCKHIGLSETALDLIAASGLDGAQDNGMHALSDPESTETFVLACRALRFWEREAMLTV